MANSPLLGSLNLKRLPDTACAESNELARLGDLSRWASAELFDDIADAEPEIKT